MHRCRTLHSSEGMRALSQIIFLLNLVDSFSLHSSHSWQVVTCFFIVTCDVINKSITVLGEGCMLFYSAMCSRVVEEMALNYIR